MAAFAGQSVRQSGRAAFQKISEGIQGQASFFWFIRLKRTLGKKVDIGCYVKSRATNPDFTIPRR
ncbi:MAG: hypothetical protein LBS31_10885, partial [Candidatus Adiutrix sp.]|nr:hypothetical protein [Candidatus Adiutrix sp.]